MLGILVIIMIITVLMIAVIGTKEGVESTVRSHNLGNVHDLYLHPEDYGLDRIELNTHHWQVDKLGRVYKDGVRFPLVKIK